MVLNFLGNGSGYADEHTSAYFITERDELVIIECSMLAVQKLKKMDDLLSHGKIYILITHTHSDHSSGLGIFCQYVYYTLKKQVSIVVPCEKVKKNIEYLLQEIEGCDTSSYELIDAHDMTIANMIKATEYCNYGSHHSYDYPWFGEEISTIHSPQLEGKCFGYRLTIKDSSLSVSKTNVIYTVDTSTLKPFIPFLTPGTELYVDISVHYGLIHLKLDDVLPELIDYAKKGVKIYLMHLDDVKAAEEIIKNIPDVNNNIQIVYPSSQEDK